ncbi:MAG: 4Fe-4S ferredoxin, partial [Acetobacteraceae bacterium]|nr:4Fe-4S ferredoxin [Acetobacteraceae bacterium]
MPPLTPQWRGRAADADAVAREFPSLAARLARPETRRHVMRLMAASAALGGLAGCDPAEPDARLVPAVNQAPNIVPGLPNHFATAFVDGGAGVGLVVRQEMGRPVKVDGNAEHPASLGASSIHGQA